MFQSERLIAEKRAVISEDRPAQGRLSKDRQSGLGMQLFLNLLFAFPVWLCFGNLPPLTFKMSPCVLLVGRDLLLLVSCPHVDIVKLEETARRDSLFQCL